MPLRASRAANGLVPNAIFQASLALLLLGMSLVLITIGTRSDGAALSTAQAVVIGGALFSVLVLTMWGTRREVAGSRLIAIVIALITVSGLPGTVSGGQIEYTGVMFFCLLAVRNYICFWGIPNSLPALPGRAQRSVMTWTLAATTAIAIGSLLAARRTGLSLASSDRLTGENHGWLNANTTGVYCAFGILICLLATFLPVWIRLAIAAVSMYCLLLSQSRTAIVALLLATITVMMLSMRRKYLPVLIVVMTVLILTGIAEPIVERAANYPAISATIQRLSGAEANVTATNRIDVLETGVEMWESSPAFGVGYGKNETHFENGLLSIACESGAFGLLAYLFFLGLVLARAWTLTRSDEEDAKELGKWLLAISVFFLVHGMGERTHAFQISSPASNCLALLSSFAFRVSARKRVARRATHFMSRIVRPRRWIQVAGESA